MKLNRNILTAPVLAMALVLTACGSDSDDEAVEETTMVDAIEGDTDSGNADGTDADSGDTDGTDGTDTDGTGTDGGDADTDGTGMDTGDAGRAIVSTVDSGFTSSVVQIIETSDPFESQNDLNPGVSDTIVRAFGDKYFVIRRYLSDSITAYTVNDPMTPLYEVSTNSDSEPDVSSNPHDLVFLNANKAYLLRYGSPLVWIVNPSAADATQFKIGEIDLSAYDTVGAPEATRGVIVDGKLYVVMQRLDGFTPSATGYVAVIDTATDTEINTNTGSLPGIELPAFNPGDLSVDVASDTIFISAFGDYGFGSTPAAFSGGVVTVDMVDYSAAQLIDDNEFTGRINNVEIISETKGYIVSSAGSDPVTFAALNSLDQFNPVTGNIDALSVAGIKDLDVRDIAVGPAGNLWVAIASAENPKIMVINPVDNSVVSDGIATTLNPTGFAFTQ